MNFSGGVQKSANLHIQDGRLPPWASLHIQERHLAKCSPVANIHPVLSNFFLIQPSDGLP